MQVCVRVWLSDAEGMSDITWLDFGGGDTSKCMPICNRLVRFHEPGGYCAKQSRWK